jgi:hypothetical protein
LPGHEESAVVTFKLAARLISCDCATIRPGYYPKITPEEPQQIGWHVVGDGELLGTPTVNLWSPPVFPAEGCVFVKITDEYAGWLESLVAAGLVEPTGRIEPAGLVERYAAECRVLNPELLQVA